MLSQELTVVLERPIEELIPAMLNWNNAELMAQVKTLLTQYEGIVYSEEQIGEAKKDKAQLNAFIKALNDERIRIGKIYTSPLDKFKSEVDEVIKAVKGVYEHIDVQVKEYDQARQAEKQREIIEYWREAVGEFAECIPYERVHCPKWLNVSVKMSAIKKDIDAIIEDARQAMTVIEGLHSEDEATIKAYYFRTLSLSDALTGSEQLKKEREQVAALKSADTTAEREAIEKTVADEAREAIAAAVTPQTMAVRFQAVGTVEQLKALRQFLISNGIQYTQI